LTYRLLEILLIISRPNIFKAGSLDFFNYFEYLHPYLSKHFYLHEPFQKNPNAVTLTFCSAARILETGQSVSSSAERWQLLKKKNQDVF
jgi:hypothetical protein